MWVNCAHLQKLPIKEAGTMEIKGINGIISTYKTTKAQTPKKSSAAVSAKNNTDRVEFGFEKTLAAAKLAITQEINADASPRELVEAQNTAEQGLTGAEIAALIFMG